MVRFLTAGESHGPSLVGIIEGMPAGLAIDVEQVNHELHRRQVAPGRGGRMKIEHDQLIVLSGLRGGKTLGSPLALQLINRDFANWQDVMHPLQPISAEEVTTPRPGHADYPGAVKYGFKDIRNVIERASARETAMRTAIGAIAKQILILQEVTICSRVAMLGPLHMGGSEDYSLWHENNNSPYGAVEPAKAKEADDLISSCREQGLSVGGTVEVVALNVPVGLGSYVHYDRRLDGRIAQGLMSIPSVKGIEIGPAFSVAQSAPGLMGDSIVCCAGELGYAGNINGGLAGGVTTGQPLVVRCAVKPIPTAMGGSSVDFATLEKTVGVKERSDVTCVPAVRVVAEAMLAWVLLEALLTDGPETNSRPFCSQR